MISSNRSLHDMHDVLDGLKAAASSVDYSLSCIERRPRWPEIVDDIKFIRTKIDSVMEAVNKAGSREQREAKKVEKAEKAKGGEA
jgi:hypothetical protein